MSLVPVFEMDMALAIARGAAAGAVWNAVRDVATYLEQPGVREKPAHEVAGLLREAIFRETGER